MCTCHYTDYDFVNQNGQLHFMYEYVGWRVGNSNVGFEQPTIKEYEQEGTTFHILANGLSSLCVAKSDA